MVAELSTKPQDHLINATHSENRVLHVLIRRHGTSQTFGENLIFMLNRAGMHFFWCVVLRSSQWALPGRTPEDLVMQLLVLKVLYILFNTKGLSEYFYTNDLCVLVDVFLREIVDLDEESESVCYHFDSMLSSNIDYLQLRHTYLRVLHPLLTKTQLRSLPYKRTQIVRALESLIANQEIREVTSTTKRLVERCLNGEWCVQHRTSAAGGRVSAELGMRRTASPSGDRVAAQSLTPTLSVPSPSTTDPSILRRRSIKGSRSAENLRSLAKAGAKSASRAHEPLRKPANDSSLNLAIASPPTVAATHAHRTGSETLADKRPPDHRRPHAHHAHPPATRAIMPPVRHNSAGMVSDQPLSPVGALSPTRSPPSPLIPTYMRTSDARVPPPSPAGSGASGTSTSTASGTTKKIQRRSPPPPPKRRKPPAVPMRVVGKSNGGAQIATIASSTSSPPASGKFGKT